MFELFHKDIELSIKSFKIAMTSPDARTDRNHFEAEIVNKEPGWRDYGISTVFFENDKHGWHILVSFEIMTHRALKIEIEFTR